MAAIAIPPVSEWSIKGDRNISCWLCDHFQRYDNVPSPPDCEGECRKESPQGKDGHTLDLTSPTDWPVDGFFPLIPNANVAWCNGFQRSLEENIPPSPGDTYQDCSHQDPTTWRRPDQERSSSMFTKKPVTESCWYCDHFQRRYVDPGSVNPAQGCGGFCQHRTQSPYTNEQGFIPPAPPQAFDQAKMRLFPRIPFAPLTWCSRFRRATQAVPDVPATGSIICAEPV